MRARMVHGLAALLMLLTVLATATGANADGVVVVTPPDCDPECGDVVYVGDQLVVKRASCRCHHRRSARHDRDRSDLPQPERLGRGRDLSLPGARRRHHRPVHDDGRRRGGRGQDSRSRRGAGDLRKHRDARCAIRPCSNTSGRTRSRPASSRSSRAMTPRPDPLPAGAHRRRRRGPLPLSAQHRALLGRAAGIGQRPCRGRVG